MLYNRPPIAEAVIDVTFVSELSVRDMERTRDKFLRQYPNVAERSDVEVKFENNKATAKMSLAGFQMNAASGLDLIIVQKRNLATSRLAPYEKWENLLETASSNLQILFDTVGRKPIRRLSTRYINRIDIPDDQIIGVSIENFFKCGAFLPESVIKDCGEFDLKWTAREVQTGLIAKTSVSTAPPALLAHQSFMIDIDVRMDDQLPLRMEEMWALADRLRVAKNNLFEACITDRARELFK